MWNQNSAETTLVEKSVFQQGADELAYRLPLIAQHCDLMCDEQQAWGRRGKVC